MALSHGPLTSDGVTTSFLPLSTPWPVAVECSSLFVSHSQSSGLYAFDPAYPISSSIQCLPPEATAVWAQSGAERTDLGGYSMVCPQAYTTAATRVIDSSSTLVGCCPSSYDFVAWASAPTPTQCSSRLPAKEVTYIQSNAAGSWSTTSSIQSVVWAVQVNGYLFAPSPTPPNRRLELRATGLDSPTPTISSSSSPTMSSASATPTDSSNYLGTATIVGMSIGLGFIAICSIVAAFRFSAKRYKRRGVKPPSQDAIGSLYPELKEDLPANVTPENFEMSPRRMRREFYPAQFGECEEARMVA